MLFRSKTALADAQEDATSVENIITEVTLDLNAPMFDVLGRQVDKTYRGIVVQNNHVFMLR